MSDIPLVTIGITCFNAEDTIARAIEGALSQDYPLVEVVVVDDGSSDASPSIVKDMASRDDRIRFIEHDKNKGFPSALNTMLKESHGDFIAIFDDDDESHTDRISAQVSTITSYEEKTGQKLVACYCSLQKKYPNGYVVTMSAIGSKQKNPIGDDMVRYHLYLERPDGVFYGGGTPSCGLMARKETFQRFGDYDVQLRRNEDCDFAVRLGLMGAHFIGTEKIVLTQFSSSGSDKRPEIARDSELAFINKYAEILKQKGVYAYAKDWIYVRYYHFSRQKWRAIGMVLLMSIKYPMLTLRRFVKAAPRRLAHEWKMKQQAKT